jgi:hypothetical protein
MKVILNFIFLTTLILVSHQSAATEQKTDPLSEVMASLKEAYGRYYDRQSNRPISIPSTIVNRYQSLMNTPDTSTEDRAKFISEMQQNIADFKAAEEIGSKIDQIYNRLEMSLLILGLKPQLPANIKLIGSSYRGIIESKNFTGADILDLEKRYQAALIDYAKDGFELFDDLRELQGMAYTIGRDYRELTGTDKAVLEPKTTEFYASLDEIEQLTKQHKWSTANTKVPQATQLGNQVSKDITAILDNRERNKVALVKRFQALDTELNELKITIDKLADKVEPYSEELSEPCDNVRVDYSCAERCPDKRERDDIFGFYKNVPDYRCLSACNNAERQKQMDDDREKAACFDEKDRIIDKANSINAQRNDLINRFNHLLKEYESLKAKLRAE